ncbi:2'-5' RNA ligase family protein [Bacillus salacetis]|uniref:2'-5' RNA ligase family protein n=1 Tax=Bacillus salacetis TaxID=2315464 RepID=A0A3A1R3G8_9BACI|nr:2'-5' RNA ligase family protein [Bacillus salacetis]RIW37265.1 2'-5' RNA ligase family protein [Bacillus salacetis]
MYWVAALFDDETEQLIKNLWNELREESISFYADEIKNGRPHITLASYKEIDKQQFIEGMKEFYNDKEEVKICFNTVGSFLNYGTLFFSPTVSTELLDLHASHYEFFKEDTPAANDVYVPGEWIPHCTLANKLTEEELAVAFQYCLKKNDLIKGVIKEIALIQLAEVDEGQIEAPVVYSIPLKKAGNKHG